MNYERPRYPVGDRIRYFRELKGWSVNRLANRAGVSQSYLRDIELENKNPTVEFLSLLCDTLDITLGEFFGDADVADKDDPLFQRIYQLDAEQRGALLAFLNTI